MSECKGCPIYEDSFRCEENCGHLDCYDDIENEIISKLKLKGVK